MLLFRKLLMLVACTRCRARQDVMDATCAGGGDTNAAEWVSMLQRQAASSQEKHLVHQVSASVLDTTIAMERTVTCQCETSDPSWVRTSRTTPRCVFIDLGANIGQTFDQFLNNSYVNIADCPGGGSWYSILVEANPVFDAPLQKLQQQYGKGQVSSLSSTAGYSCDGATTFYLDVVNPAYNYWGSSMSSKAVDVRKSGGKKKVVVPTVNLNRLLLENTIPEDNVVVKMDIEGAEWDIMPCLSRSPSATLMDNLFVEFHPITQGLLGTTDPEMKAIQQKLRDLGVNMPEYSSPTLLEQSA